MHPFTPDPSLNLPPMSADEAYAEFGISNAGIDAICKIMKIDPNDKASTYLATRTFHEDLFTLMNLVDAENPKHPDDPLIRYEDIDWHAMHADPMKEHMAYKVFQECKPLIDYNRAKHHGINTGPAPNIPSSTIALMEGEICILARMLGFETPLEPSIFPATATQENREHHGTATPGAKLQME